MKYKMEIIQEFEGKINNIKIDDKRRYYSIGFMLDCLVERDIKFNNRVVRMLDGIIEYVLRKNYIALGVFEEDVYFAIDINHRFPMDYMGGLFEEVNEVIKFLNE